MPTRDWEVFIPSAQFERLKSDKRMHALIGLGRITNALSLGYASIMAPVDYSSPRSMRERSGAFLYTGAMLAEGLHFAQALGQYFRDLPQYQNGFAKILGDPEVKRLRSRYLKPLRDKATFHFDLDVVPEALGRMQFKDYVLARGRGKTACQIYFPLADDVVHAFLVGPHKDDAEYLKKLEEFMMGSSELYGRFMRAAHPLIPAALLTMGALRRTVKPSAA